MQRRCFLKWALCGCLGLLAVNIPAQACKGPVSIPYQVAHTDLVMLGTVTAIEEKNVLAIPLWGATDAVPHQIAVVRVEEVFSGVQGVTHVRIGFTHMPDSVKIGMKGCFLLKKHRTESFYVDPANFAANRDLTLVKKCARLFADPNAGLKSKDAEERFLTAAMLVMRHYRTLHTPNAKTEPIDAEQSRLSLKALAECDWSKIYSGVQPYYTFSSLNLTEKDGWKLPKKATRQQLIDQAQQWLKASADSYRLQRFVDAE